MRGLTRPPLRRGTLIWILGLTLGIVAGAASLYLITGVAVSEIDLTTVAMGPSEDAR